MRKITIVDIAKELDLSPSTVSRALNGTGRMNQATRQKVIELAEKWHYHPNPHAQRLKKSKTLTIGLVVPELTHHFYSQIVKGVDSILDVIGYQQIICVSNEEYEKEKNAVIALLNARVDGLLIALSNETKDYQHIQQIIDEEIPLVFLDRTCEDIDAPYVTTNDFEGAKTAVKYLIELGCKHIGFIQGPENISTTFNRLTGYKEALRANNMPLNEKLIVRHENQERFSQRLKEIVEVYHVDAILAHSDYHAFKAMKELQGMGYKIPEDLKIIGFADEPLASYTTPTITTVKQPAFEIGRVGMEMLMAQLESGVIGEPVMLDTELIVRSSTTQL